MRIETIRSEGLAQLSYFIVSEGEALVVDPRRDVDVYLNLAAKHEAEIKHIFETHRNEDYVIGSAELKYYAPTARIGHSNATSFKYGDDNIADGETFTIGNVKITCVNTPGHTPDSMCYLLSDRSVGDDPLIVLTGDTLFVNEVGRTDLVDIKRHEEMSRTLYHSLYEKVLSFGDGVIVYPGHGAGSVCGGAIGKRDFTTIGYERSNNKWLSMDEEDFVTSKLNQRLTLAPYFKNCERLNTVGPPLLAEMDSLKILDVDMFEMMLNDPDYYAIDTRSPAEFNQAHIPGSISMNLNDMGLFAGWVAKPEHYFLFVLQRHIDFPEAWGLFVRVGLDNVVGYLARGLEGWADAGKQTRSLQRYLLDGMKDDIDNKVLTPIDVRQSHEFEKERIANSKSVPLTVLQDNLESLRAVGPKAIICPAGVRGTTAASVMLRAGIEDVVVPIDGFKGWKRRMYPIEQNVD
ncbi:MAG: MBL fold metallo-hydrolase [Candidatus Thorarchaeota archaeon]